MMKRLMMTLPIAALLSACGSEAAEDQPNAAANAQEANMAQAMPSGPFAQIEMQMHERMMAATGSNASDTWARKMIEHHRGAVQMSQLLIDQGGTPDMVSMARQMAEKQQREIAELERLVRSGISGSGPANPFAPGEQQMSQAMMAASGADLSETWARKMIVHHQGAVDMSELLLRQQGTDPRIAALARKTVDDQRREIAHLQAMLRGEPMQAAPAPAAAAPAAAPAARSKPAAPKAVAAKQPAPKREAAAPRAAPAQTPTPAPAPKETCTAEHRAMGHC